MLPHLLFGLLLPSRKHTIIPRIHLLHIMIHILNQQDVIIQCLLIFRITLALCSHHSRRFLSNDLQALEHCLVDLLVGIVYHFPDFELIVFAGCGEHVFYCDGEVREGVHEADYAFAFFDFDFCVFDGADLLVDEAGEQAGETLVHFL